MFCAVWDRSVSRKGFFPARGNHAKIFAARSRVAVPCLTRRDEGENVRNSRDLPPKGANSSRDARKFASTLLIVESSLNGSDCFIIPRPVTDTVASKSETDRIDFIATECVEFSNYLFALQMSLDDTEIIARIFSAAVYK
ncbi:hypothetical protein CAJAP_01237 [Camponotus japonicus]